MTSREWNTSGSGGEDLCEQRLNQAMQREDLRIVRVTQIGVEDPQRSPVYGVRDLFSPDEIAQKINVESVTTFLKHGGRVIIFDEEESWYEQWENFVMKHGVQILCIAVGLALIAGGIKEIILSRGTSP